MTLATDDINGITLDFVNESLAFRDSSAPIAGELVPEGFGFPNAGVAIALNIPNQFMNFFEDLFILIVPVQILLPGIL
jgi:hypothetical protein